MKVALVGVLAICLLGAGGCGTTGLSTQQVGSLNLSGANGHERRHYLSRALELYRGKYLEDCYMDFAVSIREGLERQLVSSALGRPKEAIRLYESCKRKLSRELDCEPPLEIEREYQLAHLEAG